MIIVLIHFRKHELRLAVWVTCFCFYIKCLPILPRLPVPLPPTNVRAFLGWASPRLEARIAIATKGEP